MADDVDIGSEQFNEDDRRYSGSRFREVVDALFANPYQSVWGRAGEPPLPIQDVTIRSVFGGLLQRATAPRFERASERTLDSGADLRWGPDRKGFARLLHPNGVCLAGRWEITEDTPYSGYFARGRTALVVARYSSGAGGPLRGSSASSFRQRIPIIRRHSEPRTSSHRRTSAGHGATPSTPPNFAMRPT